MGLIPPRPIPQYRELLQQESDWQALLKYSQEMLERLQDHYSRPDPEQFQAVVHLMVTLAPGHYRRLH